MGTPQEGLQRSDQGRWPGQLEGPRAISGLEFKVRALSTLVDFSPATASCLGTGEDIETTESQIFFFQIYVYLSSETPDGSKQRKTRYELQGL